MKCPKCKKEVDQVYVEQEFSTTAKGVMAEGNLDLDIEAGYSNLQEWIDNMLMERGRLKFIGCKRCLK